ncbi:MAG: anti-sigma factor [Methylocystis sp.]
MSQNVRIEEADLHALVDGEISVERRHAVEDHLLQHPEDAALVENWRRQNAALRAAFEPVAQETPPLSLRNAAARNAAAGGGAPIETGVIHWGRPSGSPRSVRRLDEARGSRRKKALLSAAMAVLVGAALAGALVYAFTRPPIPPGASGPVTIAQGYVDRADIAYLTYAADPRPVEFDAEHWAELAAALKPRVGFASAPDLSAAGLRLLGGRIAPGLKGPAGLLFYQSPAGDRIALYFERAEPENAMRAAPRVDQNLTAIEWRGAGMAFVMIGPLDADTMQAAAERAVGEILATASEAKQP